MHRAGFDTFRNTIAPRCLVLVTTKGTHSLNDFAFASDDALLFGKESGGVLVAIAQACQAAHCDGPISTR